MTFTWKLSYRNESEYRFDGGSIGVYRELGWLEPHMRQDHNGDAESFQRNVLDAAGGARIFHDRYRAEDWNRWTPEIYTAFVAHLRAKHAQDIAESTRLRARHPDIDFSGCDRPLAIPRPIYWDFATNRFETEPWHEEAA
jgi:phytoene dehydrogenase-like protein